MSQDLQAFRSELRQRLTNRLPRFCTQMDVREGARLRRMALSHFSQIPDEELEELINMNRELTLPLVIGRVFARMAFAIHEDERRHEDEIFFDGVQRSISRGIDGKAFPSIKFEAAMDQSVLVMSLHKVLASLAQNEPDAHHVLVLRYFDDMTRQQISDTLAIGASRVRRLEDVGVNYLKAHLKS